MRPNIGTDDGIASSNERKSSHIETKIYRRFYKKIQTMSKWRNTYRIDSARAPWWDYGSDGAYFITICTENRQHFFGKCIKGKMSLSAEGAIVQGFWYEIPYHFPFVHLGEFIVMPNHIHGIIIIDKSGADIETEIEDINLPDFRTPAERRVNTQGKHTASSIIGSYKSICTKHINKLFPTINFGWQERFWDNIIKSDADFDRISNYIHKNRENWDKDKFYDE
jgi:putative transposase